MHQRCCYVARRSLHAARLVATSSPRLLDSPLSFAISLSPSWAEDGSAPAGGSPNPWTIDGLAFGRRGGQPHVEAANRVWEDLKRRVPLHVALLTVEEDPLKPPLGGGPAPAAGLLTPDNFKGGPLNLTPVHCAVLRRFPHAVAALAAAGAPLDEVLADGNSIDQLVLMDRARGLQSTWWAMCQRGAPTPLSIAVLQGDWPEVVEALLRGGAALHDRQLVRTEAWAAELTLLHLCVCDHLSGQAATDDDVPRLHALELLLEHGADPLAPNTVGIPGFMPLSSPLEQAWHQELNKAGLAMARALATRLQRQGAVPGMTHEEALLAASVAAQQRDVATALALLDTAAALEHSKVEAGAEAAAAPAPASGTGAWEQSRPRHTWRSLLWNAAFQGLAGVTAAVLAKMSAQEREEALPDGSLLSKVAAEGHAVALEVLSRAGARFGLSEREDALYTAIVLALPAGVCLALDVPGGPADLVAQCRRTMWAFRTPSATQGEKGKHGTQQFDVLNSRKLLGPVAALVDAAAKGFPRVSLGQPDAEQASQLQQDAAEMDEMLLEAGFVLEPPPEWADSEGRSEERDAPPLPPDRDSATEGGGRLRQCSGCRLIYLCGSGCQHVAWKAGHRRDCPLLRELAAAGGEERTTLAAGPRFAALRESGGYPGRTEVLAPGPVI
eukprot:scaffold29.g5934.t1